MSANDVIVTVALYFPRIFTVFFIIPIFSTRVFCSALVKNSFVMMILFCFILSEENYISADEITSLGYYIFAVIVKEIVIGFIIGISFSILFWSIDSAGQIIDTMRGSSLASVFNPLLNDSTSITGTILYYLTCAIFVCSGGLNTIVKVIYESYVICDVISLQFPGVHFPTLIHTLWNSFLELFIGFSLPFIIVFTLCDLTLGFMNRASPQFNAFSLSMPIKSIVSVIFLAIVVYKIPEKVISTVNNIHSQTSSHLASDKHE